MMRGTNVGTQKGLAAAQNAALELALSSLARTCEGSTKKWETMYVPTLESTAVLSERVSVRLESLNPNEIATCTKYPIKRSPDLNLDGMSYGEFVQFLASMDGHVSRVSLNVIGYELINGKWSYRAGSESDHEIINQAKRWGVDKVPVLVWGFGKILPGWILQCTNLLTDEGKMVRLEAHDESGKRNKERTAVIPAGIIETAIDIHLLRGLEKPPLNR